MKKMFLFILLLTKLVITYADDFVPTVVLKNNESHRVGFKICTPTCKNPVNTVTQFIYPGASYNIPNIVGVSSGPLVTIESLDTAYATVITNNDGSISISHSMAPKFALYKAFSGNNCDTYTVYSKTKTRMFLSQSSTTFDSSCGGNLSPFSTYINSNDSSAIVQINYNTNLPQ